MTRFFRVGHAQIDLSGLWRHAPDSQFLDALRQSWVPGTEVTRYGRSWRISRYAEDDSGLWTGHIGYIENDAFSTLDWDDETKEFRREAASGGTVVPFAISAPRRLVSFQFVPGDIRTHTVTTNLQALLNNEGGYRWDITPLTLRRTFDEWQQSVSNITKVQLQLRYPNPNWHGRENLQQLVDGLNAETVRIEARAEEGESIDIDSPWFRQAMDHALLSYGTVTATGIDRETGSRSIYTETSDGGTIEATGRIPASEEAVELLPDDLEQSQRSLVERYEADFGTATTNEDDDSARD